MQTRDVGRASRRGPLAARPARRLLDRHRARPRRRRIALPPIAARSWVLSLVICLIAVMLGVGVIIRGERRFGGYAVASGVLGFSLGFLATLSGVGKLDTVVVWSALFVSTLRYATPLIFAAIGGCSASTRAW